MSLSGIVERRVKVKKGIAQVRGGSNIEESVGKTM